MPKAATLSSFVETAAKCFATAASPSAATSRARALAALAIVSCVVKVLDDTMKSVRARSRSAERVGEIGAVDIGDEMRARAAVREWRQRARRHSGAEIGTADADVHDVGEGLARRALHVAAANGAGESENFFALGLRSADAHPRRRQ